MWVSSWVGSQPGWHLVAWVSSRVGNSQTLSRYATTADTPALSGSRFERKNRAHSSSVV